MRLVRSLLLATLLLSAASADAQTIGTFNWRLSQCGGNFSLPASGVAVPQVNGTIFFGVTSINENGRGLHTRGYITLPTLSGTWSDNAGNSNQQFLPTVPASPNCVGGPRTGPNSPDLPPAQP
jgi:hypothetical protein